jgi:cell division protein ZapB
MTDPAPIVERVERLLLRHEELKRTNDLLRREVTVLAAERDSLRSRLAAARARIDALLDRLPASPAERGDKGNLP